MVCTLLLSKGHSPKPLTLHSQRCSFYFVSSTYKVALKPPRAEPKSKCLFPSPAKSWSETSQLQHQKAQIGEPKSKRAEWLLKSRQSSCKDKQNAGRRCLSPPSNSPNYTRLSSYESWKALKLPLKCPSPSSTGPRKILISSLTSKASAS